MTLQEAIIHLDYLKDFKTPDQVEALDMAIAELKRQAEIERLINSLDAEMKEGDA